MVQLLKLIKFVKVLKGYKTYVAAAGLVGLALYDLSIGNWDQATQNLLAGLAAFGLRSAIEPPKTPEVLVIDDNGLRVA